MRRSIHLPTRFLLLGIVIFSGGAWAQQDMSSCALMRTQCVSDNPQVERMMALPCRMSVEQHEARRAQAPQLPTVEACIGPERATRILGEIRQQKAAAAEQVANLSRPGRDGVSFFGYELGTAPDIPLCTAQGIHFSRDTCAMSANTGRSGLSLLEVNFSPKELPGFIARSGMIPPYIDVRLRLANGATEGLGFSIKYPLRSQVIEALDKKLGPHKSEAVPMHNDVGGSWTGESFDWSRGETQATLNCLEFRPSTCEVSISTKALKDFAKKSMSDEASKGRQL